MGVEEILGIGRTLGRSENIHASSSSEVKTPLVLNKRKSIHQAKDKNNRQCRWINTASVGNSQPARILPALAG